MIILKAARGKKTLIYKGNLIKLSPDFSPEFYRPGEIGMTYSKY